MQVLIPYLLTKITKKKHWPISFIFVAESLFKSYWYLRKSEWLKYTTEVTITQVRE